ASERGGTSRPREDERRRGRRERREPDLRLEPRDPVLPLSDREDEEREERPRRRPMSRARARERPLRRESERCEVDERERDVPREAARDRPARHAREDEHPDLREEDPMLVPLLPQVADAERPVERALEERHELPPVVDGHVESAADEDDDEVDDRHEREP